MHEYPNIEQTKIPIDYCSDKVPYFIIFVERKPDEPNKFYIQKHLFIPPDHEFDLQGPLFGTF